MVYVAYRYEILRKHLVVNSESGEENTQNSPKAFNPDLDPFLLYYNERTLRKKIMTVI